MRTYYSEEESNALESRWWDYILPTSESNIKVIEEYEALYKEYKQYKQVLELLNEDGSNGTLEFLSELYGKEVAGKILARAKNIVKSENLYYPDNFRVAAVLNVEQMEIFYKKQRGGCCGRFDEQFDIGGVKFMIGFNFGH